METSILVARILATVYLAVGIGMLFSRTYYIESIEKLLKDTTYLFLGGWIATAIGVALVTYHNLWVNDWRLLITVVSWVVLIKGVLLLAFPKWIKVFEPWFTQAGIRNYITPMVFILGFIFGWFGFYS